MHLTAITPSGGRQAALDLCGRWMAEQTFQDFEWVVLDDCDPPSDMPDRVDRVIRPGWRWRPGTNSQARSMLALLEAADGPVVVIEDDDVYLPGHLKQMAVALEHVNLVGERDAVYYHVGRRTYVERTGLRNAVMASTALKGEAKERLKVLCRRHRTLLDVLLWQEHRGILLDSRQVIGIKGMPGRPGVSASQTRPGEPDPHLHKLRSLIGDRAHAYETFHFS